QGDHGGERGDADEADLLPVPRDRCGGADLAEDRRELAVARDHAGAGAGRVGAAVEGGEQLMGPAAGVAAAQVSVVAGEPLGVEAVADDELGVLAALEAAVARSSVVEDRGHGSPWTRSWRRLRARVRRSPTVETGLSRIWEISCRVRPS